MPTTRRARAVPLAAATALLLPLVAACSSAPEGASSASIPVTATDTACSVGAGTVPAGVVTFAVRNAGEQMNEFYVYDSAGTRVVSEVENIGPGLTRELTAQLDAGSYVTACKPGGAGDGIRGTLTVTAAPAAASASGAHADALAAAVADYRSFVAEEAAALLAGTEKFVSTVKAGDVAAARALYPEVRLHWERIEPVAESFAELDPRLDARENDVEPGQEWTGWHRIEKALWVDGSTRGMAAYADRLLADTTTLVGLIPTVVITPALLGNGATELLQEVATGKVTGEEERYSRTDLWDFRANVDGARRAFTALSPAIRSKDAALHATLTTRFADLDAELDRHARGTGFVRYDELTPAQVRALAAKVDALAEPLSQVTATVLS